MLVCFIKKISIILIFMLFSVSCNRTENTGVDIVHVDATALSVAMITNTVILPTDTSTIVLTPTKSPTPVATYTPIPTATPTKTATSTPTNTNTPAQIATATIIPTATSTFIPIPTEQPYTSTLVPEISVVNSLYPSIPSGKGLLYVINFHSDAAQFYFFDRPEEYRISGKSLAPEGGILELFLDPGIYRWASVIEFANLRGEGQIEIVEGQIQGLGLVYGKIGPKDIVEGFLIGSDPLSPPVTPSPTPIPTPPIPSRGHTMIILNSGNLSGVGAIAGWQYPLQAGTWYQVEWPAGVYDVEFIYDRYFTCNGTCFVNSTILFKDIEFPPDNICDIMLEIKRPLNEAAKIIAVTDWEPNVNCHSIQ